MANSIHEFFQKASPTERLQFFKGGVYISPTSRCNARCRHCIAEDEKPLLVDVDHDMLLDWLDQAHECGLKVVHFVGGEPFIVRKKLIDYLKKLGEFGMYSVAVTNGFWAKTVEEGIAILEEMPDLNILSLSTDKYHLEHVDAQTVKNAIEAGLATDKLVVVNITYIDKQEVKEVSEIYKEYRNKVMIQSIKAMPFGGAANMGISREPLFQTPEKVPGYCDVGNYFVDYYGDTTACCHASSATTTNYLRLGNFREEKLAAMMERISRSKVLNFMKQFGPRGLVEIFSKSPYAKELNERQYTGPCHVCIELLNDREKLDYFLAHVS